MAKSKEPLIKLARSIDLRYKYVRTFWGKRKLVATSISEQRKLKKCILKFFPDNKFYDNLNEANSIEAGNKVFSRSMLSKPIDIRFKCKNSIWGKRRIIKATISEQQKIKKVLLKLLPDNLFYDDLGESNSVKVKTPRNSAGEVASDMYYYALSEAALNHALGDNDNNDHDCNCDDDDCDCDSDDCNCDNDDCDCGSDD